MVLQLVVGPHEKEKKRKKKALHRRRRAAGSSGRRDNHRLNMRCRTLSLSFSLLGTTRLFLVCLFSPFNNGRGGGPTTKAQPKSSLTFTTSRRAPCPVVYQIKTRGERESNSFQCIKKEMKKRTDGIEMKVARSFSFFFFKFKFCRKLFSGDFSGESSQVTFALPIQPDLFVYINFFFSLSRNVFPPKKKKQKEDQSPKNETHT